MKPKDGKVMDEISTKLIDPDGPPDISKVKAWVGAKAFVCWNRITRMIDKKYPGVFVPEWLYGGKKHGWSLRYKKSKSFCTLIPEKGRTKILIVFGAEERARVETVRDKLSVSVQKQYDAATTYHDGKWLVLTVDSERTFKDIEVLLERKRRPKVG